MQFFSSAIFSVWDHKLVKRADYAKHNQWGDVYLFNLEFKIYAEFSVILNFPWQRIYANVGGKN